MLESDNAASSAGGEQSDCSRSPTSLTTILQITVISSTLYFTQLLQKELTSQIMLWLRHSITHTTVWCVFERLRQLVVALRMVSVSSRLISFSLTLAWGIIKPSNNCLFHYDVFPLCCASQLCLNHIQVRTKSVACKLPILHWETVHLANVSDLSWSGRAMTARVRSNGDK